MSPKEITNFEFDKVRTSIMPNNLNSPLSVKLPEPKFIFPKKIS